jgi:hypothetical protein
LLWDTGRLLPVNVLAFSHPKDKQDQLTGFDSEKSPDFSGDDITVLTFELRTFKLTDFFGALKLLEVLGQIFDLFRNKRAA